MGLGYKRRAREASTHGVWSDGISEGAGLLGLPRLVLFYSNVVSTGSSGATSLRRADDGMMAPDKLLRVY